MSFTVLQSEYPTKAAARSLEILLRNTKKKVLLLLPGGSALDVVKELIIPDPKYTIIGLTDERFTIDPKDQNIFALLGIPSIVKAERDGARSISILKNDSDMEECARLYEEKVRRWKRETGGEIIALFGVGTDGHIAGMMPYPEHPKLFETMFETERLFTAYDAQEKNDFSLRITCTNTFLKKYVDSAVVYMVGNKKATALAQILVPFGTLPYTPARILLEMKQVFLYTDLKL